MKTKLFALLLLASFSANAQSVSAHLSTIKIFNHDGIGYYGSSVSLEITKDVGQVDIMVGMLNWDSHYAYQLGVRGKATKWLDAGLDMFVFQEGFYNIDKFNFGAKAFVQKQVPLGEFQIPIRGLVALLPGVQLDSIFRYWGG